MTEEPKILQIWHSQKDFCILLKIFIGQGDLKHVEHSLQFKSRKTLLVRIPNDEISENLCKYYDRPEKQVDFYLIATFC